MTDLTSARAAREPLVAPKARPTLKRATYIWLACIATCIAVTAVEPAAASVKDDFLDAEVGGYPLLLTGLPLLFLYALHLAFESKFPRKTNDRRSSRPRGYIGDWPPNRDQ